ncbi:helix-turn-helix transcriptional regulator [Sphingomonas abaci]|uniref:Prophage regulatory protein n=1 Tax=Sphingomonas abaci TaxID=237611 RepID=A0A7W7AJ41_9SPHN|nr:AlpA family phage regulatory protein [Sphingomonas abaci]MBB4617977.1 prophage regulatory protein [Sphingomonas abaci]
MTAVAKAKKITLEKAKQVGCPASAGRFLRLSDVMATTGLGRSTLYRMIANETFPRQHQLTARSIGWWEKDVADWLQRQRNGCPQA